MATGATRISESPRIPYADQINPGQSSRRSAHGSGRRPRSPRRHPDAVSAQGLCIGTAPPVRAPGRYRHRLCGSARIHALEPGHANQFLDSAHNDGHHDRATGITTWPPGVGDRGRRRLQRRHHGPHRRRNRHRRHRDIDQDIVDEAAENLARTGCRGVKTVCGDGFEGLPSNQPYDRIIVTVGSYDDPPTGSTS